MSTSPEIRLMHPSEFLEITIEPSGKRVTLRGELCLLTSPWVGETLQNVRVANGTFEVLDLRPLTFIDLQGLRAIDDVRRQRSPRITIYPGPKLDRLLDAVAGCDGGPGAAVV